MDDMQVAFCPFCGKHLSRLTPICGFCGRSLAFLNAAAQAEEPAVPGTSQQPVTAKQTAANFLTEEKKDIVADYARWYVIDINSSVIDRFKDGLSALQFLTALQQHPPLLTPVLCHSEKQITGFDIERLFTPDVSPAGSNRRQKESVILAYWADYLLDCEEGEAAVSVEEEFLDGSPFPMSNTCSNLLKLPILDSYSVFKAQIDFGIQNSPGFGCL